MTLEWVKGSITIRFLREGGELQWRAIVCVLVFVCLFFHADYQTTRYENVNKDFGVLIRPLIQRSNQRSTFKNLPKGITFLHLDTDCL